MTTRTERPAWQPGSARVGEPSPQTHPELFTIADLQAEIRYLTRLDKRYGWHELRAIARQRLWTVIGERKLAEPGRAS